MTLRSSPGGSAFRLLHLLTAIETGSVTSADGGTLVAISRRTDGNLDASPAATIPVGDYHILQLEDPAPEAAEVFSTWAPEALFGYVRRFAEDSRAIVQVLIPIDGAPA